MSSHPQSHSFLSGLSVLLTFQGFREALPATCGSALLDVAPIQLPVCSQASRLGLLIGDIVLIFVIQVVCLVLVQSWHCPIVAA